MPGSISRLKYLKESDFRDNRLRGELPNFLDGCSSLDAVMTKWKNRKGELVGLKDRLVRCVSSRVWNDSCA